MGSKRQSAPRATVFGLVVALALVLAAYAIEAGARRELAERYEVTVESSVDNAHDLELLRDERDLLAGEAREGALAAADFEAAALSRYQARVVAARHALEAGAPEDARELLDSTEPARRGFEWGALGLAVDLRAPYMWAHASRLAAVAISADGAWLATGDEDGNLWLGPARVGATPVEFGLGEDVIYDLCFDQAGTRVAAATAEEFVHVLSVPSGEELALLVGHEGEVIACAFAGDDTLISASEDGSLRAWALAEEVERWTIEPFRGELVALDVDARGGRFAAASDEGELALFSLEDGALLHDLELEDERWTAISFSADGARVAAGGDGGFVRVFDATTGALLVELGPWIEPLQDLWLDEGGRRLVAASRDGSLRVMDIASGLELYQLNSGDYGVECIAVDASARRVAFFTANEERAQLWGRPAPRGRNVLAGPESTATAMVADAQGLRWTTGRANGRVVVLDARSGGVITERKVLSTTVRALALSPDGTRLAVGAADGALQLLDARTLAVEFAFTGHEERIVDLSFTRDGARLASASAEGVFRLWDARKGVLVNEKPGPRQWVLASALTADGRRGLWVAGGGVVRMWDLESGERVGGFRDLSLGRVTSIALAPAGDRLVTATNQHRLRVFDVRTGEQLAEARPRPDLAVALAASPDGLRFAAGGVDGSVRLFDIAGAGELMTLAGSELAVYGLEFSPDGGRLAASLAGGSLEIWESSLEDWLEGRKE